MAISSLHIIGLSACLLCVIAANADGEPLTDSLEAPKAPRERFDVPTVRSATDARGESITLASYAMAVELRVDSSKQVTIASLRTEAERELLATPAKCFGVLHPAP